MKKILLTLSTILMMLAMPTPSRAQVMVPNCPPLHVDGNQLRDPAGNKVVLHGVMDTPSAWFNNNRWGSVNDANISACVNYFNTLFTAMTNPEAGTYANIFRLHLDPCWTNKATSMAKGFTKQNGKTIDPLGHEVGGEADISYYSGTALTKYMKTVYWRIAQQAIKHGMYVIMRPPGVCPGDIQVGTYYQDYLIDVWDRVTKNDSVLKYYGQVGIELANEPVRIRNAQGQESGDARFHDFFQPIVDKIRANGFKGIIWVPGGIWQQEYKPYAQVPITDPLNNIGYAVHDYPGWYGISDGSYNSTTGINSFASSIPVARTNPIAITEIDWSPQKPGTGHYNESGAWVESNYGTWATASTSKWGKAFRATHDHFGNLSMTLSGTHCYINMDQWNTSTKKLNKVEPAFPGIKEACGEACFEWYKEWAQVNYPSYERYQPKQEIPENPFERSAAWMVPNILFENTIAHTSSISTIKLKKGGCAGWRFEDEEGIDLSGYDSLVVNLSRYPQKNTFLRIYDNQNHANFWGDYYELNFNLGKSRTIDLHNLITKEGNKIDPAHIRIVGFVSASADQTLYFSDITLITNEADAIEAMKHNRPVPNAYYDLQGRRINNPTKGVYIKNGKKVYVK